MPLHKTRAMPIPQRLIQWAVRSRVFRKFAHSLLIAEPQEADPSEGNTLLESFVVRCQAIDRPRVLELGTKRSIAERSTRHDVWIPHASEYLGTDITSGEDVDIVADVHRLTHVVGEEQFDVIVSCSTFEHFKYPHLAAHEIMKTLRVGGVLLIQTHHAFPLHAYPYDYFRFSREALAGLFGTQMGFKVVSTAYQFSAKLFSKQEPITAQFPMFLNVLLFGEKIGKTPDTYVFEYDVS
ncbi:MAG: class I SAM-dependent methyltransferase [Deltaproteobacteria bacterium]|nr:class I SAM-dependent methyltransferase [Deltaproteobacteria bacterium]